MQINLGIGQKTILDTTWNLVSFSDHYPYQGASLENLGELYLIY
ncbi:MAG: hypothetical protein ABIA04_14745 [Pseudomonadota bacterium]